MNYEKIFAEVKKSFSKANVKNLSAEFAFQFNITGEGEGIFYAAYKKGVFSVEPYDYKDRDVIFTADGDTLIAIAKGKLEPIDAIKDGKLFVDGSEELAKQLMYILPEKKPAAKPAEKKAAPKTAAKPAAKAEVKPAPKAEVKPAAKVEAKPAPKAETKPAEVKAKTETAPAKTDNKKK